MNSRNVAETAPRSRRGLGLLYLAILLTLVSVAAIACGIKSGDRSPARSTPITVFHRTPVTAFEQFRIEVVNTEAGCTADPADVSIVSSQRVRLAIQLKSDAVTQSAGGSTQFTGERDKVRYVIQGLEISGSGGAFPTGVTNIDLELESGTRRSYDFNAANLGDFDILCDGVKIGTFTVSDQ